MMKASSGSSTKRTGVLSSAEYLSACGVLVDKHMSHMCANDHIFIHKRDADLRVMVHEGDILAPKGPWRQAPEVLGLEGLLLDLRPLSEQLTPHWISPHDSLQPL